MKRKNAELFVALMREDLDFRATVRMARGEAELEKILRTHGFGFKMDELTRARASCMDDLESSQESPSARTRSDVADDDGPADQKDGACCAGFTPEMLAKCCKGAKFDCCSDMANFMFERVKANEKK